MTKTPTTDQYWREFCAATGCPATDYAVSVFGDSAGLSESLLALVLQGRKRATACAVALFEKSGEALPQIGDHVVVTDYSGQPRCLWRTIDVRVGPLSSVDAQFAFDEGEDDRSRAEWLHQHTVYFTRESAAEGYAMAPDLPTVFERFTLVWPPEVADPPASDAVRMQRGRYDRLSRAVPWSDDPRWRFEWADGVWRVTSPESGAHSNCVLLPDLWTEEAARAAIAAMVAHFGALGHAFEWKLHEYDRPTSLPALLSEAGFVAEEDETIVVRDLVAHPPRPLTVPPGMRLVEITDEAGFAALKFVNSTVYGTGSSDHADWLVRVLSEEKQHKPDRLRLFYVADAEGPVSTGWLRLPDGEGFASLWGGATLPRARGKGLYRLLVEHRAALAVAAGETALTIDCSPMSLPIALANGFEVLARATPWIWRPPLAS